MMMILACSQKVTAAFSVFLLSKVTLIITELSGLSSSRSCSNFPFWWLMKMEGIFTL